MTINCGDWLYCRTGKYRSGTVTEIKNKKFFIDTGTEILELDITEVEHNFTKDK